jgi:hypothetical protein
MQDVAGRMLDDFAKRFETYLISGDTEPTAAAAADGEAGETAGTMPPPSGDAGAGPPPASAGDDQEALDLGSVLFKTPAVQRGAIAILVVLLLAVFARRRRRS